MSELPWHHRDPCDRLLLGQAMDQELCVITADKHFQAYPISVCW